VILLTRASEAAPRRRRMRSSGAFDALFTNMIARRRRHPHTILKRSRPTSRKRQAEGEVQSAMIYPCRMAMRAVVAVISGRSSTFAKCSGMGAACVPTSWYLSTPVKYIGSSSRVRVSVPFGTTRRRRALGRDPAEDAVWNIMRKCGARFCDARRAELGVRSSTARHHARRPQRHRDASRRRESSIERRDRVEASADNVFRRWSSR